MIIALCLLVPAAVLLIWIRIKKRDGGARRIATVLIVFISCLATASMLYLVMFISTNKLMEEAREYMAGNIIYIEERRGSPLARYGMEGGFGTTSVEYSITRMLVLHNFSEGNIWIEYTQVGYNDDGEITQGSWRVPARWKIQRIDGEWEVLEIFEGP